jgi:hypothetical protein
MRIVGQSFAGVATAATRVIELCHHDPEVKYDV